MHEPQDPKIETLVALPVKFEADDILSLLGSLGYQAVMSADAGASGLDIQMPFYFTEAQMVVFPPSTDNPNNSPSRLNGIETNVNRAIAGGITSLLDKDVILFPVFEEWQARGISWSARQHWVLLVYMKAAKTVYMLDAMGPRRSDGFYGSKLVYMDKAVKTALAQLNCIVDHPLEKVYFDRQSVSDTVSGGHWVSYWLHCFKQKIDLAALKLAMTTTKLQDVKADLTRVRQAAKEIPGDSDHGHKSPPKPDIVIAENIEGQHYAQQTDQNDQRNSTAPSILLSPSTVTPKKAALSEQPLSANTRPWYRFNLDFYSMFIYAGAAIALFAMFCLASVTPLLSATVSAGVLGVGVLVFFGGVLGKYGFFSGHSRPSNTELLAPKSFPL